MQPAPSTLRGSVTTRSSHRSDALLLSALVVGLLLWFLWPFVLNGSTFLIGPDGPVYLWWTRLAGVDGLSAVADRPGVPALSLVVSGTLGLSVVQVTAGLEVALGVAVGLASAALVRGRASAAASALAGLLAGTFAVHLAAGYLANLTTAAAFLAAAALLDRPGRRALVLGALVLAGGGLAHPLFFLLGALILFVAAVTAWRTQRDEALRLGAAALGGGIVLGAGLLAVMPGAPPLDVDTSKDAFLRRAGLTSELRHAYLDRFVHRWTRYVQWVSIPLAIVGFGEASGTAGRILRSWLAVTVVGVAVTLATGWLPADRFVTFAFAIPILAALGLVRLGRRLKAHRVATVVVTGALTLAMLAGAAIAWDRQEPFLSEDEVRAVTIANDAVSQLPPGTPLAFLVNEPDDTVTFLATRAGNVIRAALPPSRIRDVVVVVPPLEFGAGSAERRALERRTSADLEAMQDRAGRPAEVFVLTPFDEVDHPPDTIFGATLTIVDPRETGNDLNPVDPLEPFSPGGIAWASIATLVLLGAAGFGWARIAFDDALTAVAASPAVGAAMLILVAVALDAFGVPIGETWSALSASALACGGGYVARFVLERRARTHPAPEVEQQPHE